VENSTIWLLLLSVFHLALIFLTTFHRGDKFFPDAGSGCHGMVWIVRATATI